MEININNKNINFLNIIKSKLITEKSLLIFKKNSINTFLVEKTLKKNDIKLILKKYFNYNKIKINSIILPQKFKTINKKKNKITQYKKIFIKLKF